MSSRTVIGSTPLHRGNRPSGQRLTPVDGAAPGSADNIDNTDIGEATAAPAAPTRRLPEKPAATPPLILIFLIVLVVPIELSIEPGGILMTPTRLFFILIAIPMAVMFLTQVKLRSYDYLIMGFAFWTAFVTFLKRPFGAGVEAGGTIILETIVIYALARVCIKRHSDITSLVWVLYGVIVVLAFLAIPEAIFKYRFMHEWLEALTGRYYYISNDERQGMLRAASTFEHPILFGLFCASALSFVWYLSASTISGIIRGIPILIGAFFALSSVGLLIFALQVMFITIERFTRKIKQRAKLAMGAIASVYIFLELASNRGAFGIMASNLTFNPHTAYYRMLQWQFAQDDIWRNPLTGIIAANWTRPYWMTSSIDNHWVYQTLRGGLPSTIMLIAAIFLIIRRVYRQPDAEVGETHAKLRRGWSYMVLALCLGAATVTFFGKMQPIFMFYIGMGASLIELAPKTAPTQDAEPTGRRKRAKTGRNPSLATT